MTKASWSPEDSSRFEKARSSVGAEGLPIMEAFFLRNLKDRKLLEPDHELLSIGPGLALLEKELLSKNLVRSVIFAEPAPQYFEDLMKTGLFDPQSSNCGFEETAPIRKCDLILSVNSWYYVGREKAAFAHARKWLRDDGSIFIAMISEQTFGHKVQVWFRGEEAYMTGEDLSSWLTDQGINHQSEIDQFKRPLSQFYSREKKAFTEAGQNWITFVAGKDFDSFSDEETSKVEELFLSQTNDKDELIYSFRFLEIKAHDLP